MPRPVHVAIVGAGVSGICMGIKLKRAGIDSFTIYEKADDLGGTWRDNTYPGLTCDVPSRYYSYSFEPNPDWSSVYAPGGEIQRYLGDVADRCDVRRHMRFGAEVASARFEDGSWRIRTRDGREDRADFLVSACGVSHHPRVPDIPGLDSFAGAAFHSARWDHDVDLRGKRVAVVGTGSSGVQIVASVAGGPGRLVHFQRTPQWVVPMSDLRYRRPTRWLVRRFPLLNRLGYRVWQAYFEGWFGTAVVKPGLRRRVIGAICRLSMMAIRDRELRRKLTPTYEPMCKRLVRCPGFYRAVQRPDVDVVTDAIDRVEPAGIVTADGRLHELDVIVLATGFQAHAYLRPIELVGEGGIRLDDLWHDGAWAHRSVALPGFPNFFMLIGPYSPIGNRSLFIVAEDQADFVMRFIEMFVDGTIATAAPRPDAAERFRAEIREAMPATVWTTGCRNWYQGADGMPDVWPWKPKRHGEMMREPATQDFELVAPAGGLGVSGGPANRNDEARSESGLQRVPPRGFEPRFPP